MPSKLVLVVVDAMHPGMLERAMSDGAAPTFAELTERGSLVTESVSSFPSVTPVCSAEIMTGHGPSGHWIPGMNWYHRVEGRYVEYGSSFEASRTFGVLRSMYDLVYNMNLEHLSWERETVFDRLGDAGVHSAITPFLIYRGRTRHELSLEGLVARAAAAANFRHAVWAPEDFFYGDLYASRSTGCGPSFTRPGGRDEYATCVGEELMRAGDVDFFCFSLPDNDFHSHRLGPEETVESISQADASMARLMDAAGGTERFLSEYAVIVTSDHAQTPVSEPLELIASLQDRWKVLDPNDETPGDAELAVSPTSRAGAVYVLGAPDERAARHAEVREVLLGDDAVDLIGWLAGPDGEPVVRSGTGVSADGLEAVVQRGGHEIRFRPGEGPADARGFTWQIRGDHEALNLEVAEGGIGDHDYPNGLLRMWSALISPHAGDVLVSAADGYECVDWGGVSHVGGGSHGALSREDSLSPIILCGTGPDDPGRRSWSLRDLAPMVLSHFGIAPDPEAGP